MFKFTVQLFYGIVERENQRCKTLKSQWICCTADTSFTDKTNKTECSGSLSLNSPRPPSPHLPLITTSIVVIVRLFLYFLKFIPRHQILAQTHDVNLKIIIKKEKHLQALCREMIRLQRLPYIRKCWQVKS